MSEAVDVIDELERAAIEVVQGQRLRLTRRKSAEGLLVDMVVEGRNRTRVTSAAIQVRPWPSGTWHEVAGYAKREMDYLQRARVAAEVAILVPGGGDPPPPLCTLDGLRRRFACWSPSH